MHRRGPVVIGAVVVQKVIITNEFDEDARCRCSQVSSRFTPNSSFMLIHGLTQCCCQYCHYSWHPESHGDRAAAWARKRLVKVVNGTHGFRNENGYEKGQYFAPKFVGAKGKLRYLDDDGKQHSSWFDSQLGSDRRANGARQRMDHVN